MENKLYVLFILFILIAIKLVNGNSFSGNNSEWFLVVEDGEGSPFIAQNTSISSFLLYIGNDYLANLTEIITTGPSGGGGGGKEAEKPTVNRSSISSILLFISGRVENGIPQSLTQFNNRSRVVWYRKNIEHLVISANDTQGIYFAPEVSYEFVPSANFTLVNETIYKDLRILSFYVNKDVPLEIYTIKVSTSGKETSSMFIVKDKYLINKTIWIIIAIIFFILTLITGFLIYRSKKKRKV